MQLNNWYTMTKPGDAQGIIADEETGKTIAVCYGPAHADLIAAAPDLLAAALKVIEAWEGGDLAAAVRELQEATDKAQP